MWPSMVNLRTVWTRLVGNIRFRAWRKVIRRSKCTFAWSPAFTMMSKIRGNRRSPSPECKTILGLNTNLWGAYLSPDAETPFADAQQQIETNILKSCVLQKNSCKMLVGICYVRDFRVTRTERTISKLKTSVEASAFQYLVQQGHRWLHCC